MADGVIDVAQPDYKIQPNEIQAFGTLKELPIALAENARAKSVGALNQILVDTMTLRDLYKKHHWQVSGVTFYQLHLLLDKHYEEQAGFVDDIAERIQSLGGLAYAMAHGRGGQHQDPPVRPRAGKTWPPKFPACLKPTRSC